MGRGGRTPLMRPSFMVVVEELMVVVESTGGSLPCTTALTWLRHGVVPRKH